MVDTIVQVADDSAHRGRAARFAGLLRRIIAARRTRLALDALSDDLLADNGLSRCDIPFVSTLVASSKKDETRDPLDRVNQGAAELLLVPPVVPRRPLRLALAVGIFLIAALSSAVLFFGSNLAGPA